MSRERIPCVYLLCNRPRGTLYIGVTSDLPVRIWQHRNDAVDGFTNRYSLHTLAWWEVHITMDSAILREKALKAWKRLWKIELVESSNPHWRDLSADIL
ncbi:GIY-YIG nuclease family protein [Luteimonas sp. A611]